MRQLKGAEVLGAGAVPGIETIASTDSECLGGHGGPGSFESHRMLATWLTAARVVAMGTGKGVHGHDERPTDRLGLSPKKTGPALP